MRAEDAAALERRLEPWVELEGGGPPGWATRLAAYLDLLRDWNQRVNLVSRKSVDRLVEEQVVPSLAALRVVPPDEPLRVLDVGSGGGLPGVPIAILRPQVRVDLVEATRKKCTFLEAAIQVSGVTDARVHWCRIEQPTPELLARGPFDVAFARSVGNADRIGAAVRDQLAGGGVFWIFVSPGTKEALPWPPAGEAVTAILAVARAA